MRQPFERPTPPPSDPQNRDLITLLCGLYSASGSTVSEFKVSGLQQESMELAGF